MRVKDIRPAPAEIEYKNMKFLITDRPNDQTIHTFIQVSMKEEEKKNWAIHVSFLTRFCTTVFVRPFLSLTGTEEAQCERGGESLRTNV